MFGLAIAIGIIIGLAVGGLLGFFFSDRRVRSHHATLAANLAAAETRAGGLSLQIDKETQVSDALRSQLSTVQHSAATLGAQLAASQQNLLEQRKLLDDAHAKLNQAFASVSAEALAKNSEAFLQLAKERFTVLSTEAAGTLEQRKAQIEGLLKPMHEMLQHYQSRLGDIEKSRVESYSMLREQLGTLAETQRTLNMQTSQLVTALRRPQTRGQWGEITLRRLIELAGMSSHCDFEEQASVTSEESRQRPDVVIHLPGDREIVIDCKVVLDAFLDAAGTTDDDVRRTHLVRHAQQVRSRARDLSAKAYWQQFKTSPEYVVMFLPGEATLYAAVEHDASIIEDCLKNRVIVATPTTLIALLKAVEFGWRQEAVTQNAEEIRKYGKELYERIAVVAGHFARLGATLNSAIDQFNTTVGSMESRVLVTARKIAELGAKSDKELAEPQLIDTRTRDVTSVSSSVE